LSGPASTSTWRSWPFGTSWPSFSVSLHGADDHRFRPHLSLDKDAPVPRRIQPPDAGAIVEVAHVGGVQHHDERRAA